jgi:ribulose 1,5-bisphosphate synthetase/thiazole synthase
MSLRDEAQLAFVGGEHPNAELAVLVHAPLEIGGGEALVHDASETLVVRYDARRALRHRKIAYRRVHSRHGVNVSAWGTQSVGARARHTRTNVFVAAVSVSDTLHISIK